MCAPPCTLSLVLPSAVPAGFWATHMYVPESDTEALVICRLPLGSTVKLPSGMKQETMMLWLITYDYWHIHVDRINYLWWVCWCPPSARWWSVWASLSPCRAEWWGYWGSHPGWRDEIGSLGALRRGMGKNEVKARQSHSLMQSSSIVLFLSLTMQLSCKQCIFLGFLHSTQPLNSSVSLDILFLRMFLPCTVSCTWRWVEPAAFLAVHE